MTLIKVTTNKELGPYKQLTLVKEHVVAWEKNPSTGKTTVFVVGKSFDLTETVEEFEGLLNNRYV